MRRKDREMDKKFAYYVIDSCNFGTLSVINLENQLYNIPLSTVRYEDQIFFHSAKEGTKVDIFKNNPDVCVSFVTDIKVPNNYSKSQLDDFKENPKLAKELISNVFTTEFASAIINGKINLIEDEDKKVHGMKLICQKYTPQFMEYFPMAINSGLSRVNVYSISIDSVTSKRKKYDSKGVEMKWMREE